MCFQFRNAPINSGFSHKPPITLRFWKGYVTSVNKKAGHMKDKVNHCQILAKEINGVHKILGNVAWNVSNKINSTHNLLSKRLWNIGQ